MKRASSVSLYYKLFFVFGVTFLGIVFILNGSVSRLSKENEPEAHRRLFRLAAIELAREIGVPPDPRHIRDIEKAYQVLVVVQGRDFLWPQDFAGNTAVLAAQPEVARAYYSQARFYFVPLGVLDRLDFVEGSRIVFDLLLCFALILASSIAVRYLLRPLAALTDAARLFSAGNLARRVSGLPADEIGALGSAFNQMAERIQRQISSLKEMAIGVSHEIRSPLTRMRLALENVPDSRSKQVIASQIEEIDSVTGQILEREALNSGISELHRQNFDLAEMLREMAAHYQESGHAIAVQVPASCTVLADRRRLEMCVKNILDNSFQYASSPVEISLTAGDAAEIVIKDRGGRSERTPSTGYGFGLKLCESIIHAHSGELRVEKTEAGTAVRLRFPSNPTA
jgi:signal transduction histidine kinase